MYERRKHLSWRDDDKELTGTGLVSLLKPYDIGSM